MGEAKVMKDSCAHFFYVLCYFINTVMHTYIAEITEKFQTAPIVDCVKV